MILLISNFFNKKTLNCTIQELLELEPIEYNPAFEKNLPEFFDFISINFLIDSVEIISDIHKTFLKLIIKERFNALFN